MRYYQHKGFTLVELLVVVAIIAILSVIGITVFTSAQASARDGRRKSDIDAIAKALETKRNAGAVYYSNVSTTSFTSAAVPADTTNSYCIRTTTAAGGVTDNPTTSTNGSWVSGNCPNTAAGGGETTWGTFGTTSIPASAIGWKVCAKLETTDTSSNPIVYCKSSSQ